MKTILAACALSLFFGGVLSESYFSPFLGRNVPLPTGPKRAESNAVLKNFTQKLDHFNSEDNTTWTQYYYANSEFFNETAKNVVFLQLGGEGPINENYVLYGSWIWSASNYGALLIQLEHRFYGDSQPFDDLSTENLRYLTSDQALADAANFIKAMHKEYSLANDTKWIVYGGSYSGALSAWMRLKYPDLVHGSVSSSSPLFAKMDFKEYFQVTVDDLNITSNKCLDNLKTAMSQVETIRNNSTANETVSSILNVCVPIDGIEADNIYVQSFYNRMAHFFSGVAQTNLMADPPLTELCDILTNETIGTEIARLAEVVKLIQGTDCVANDYWGNVESWQYIYTFAGARQWMFQTCNEFGWFQPSNRDDEVFGIGSPLSYTVNLCADVFGSEFDEAYIAGKIDETNTKYGGTDINVTNVVFVHGSFDPWHPLGITETKNPAAPAIYIEGTAHCADQGSFLDNDLPQLTAARIEVNRLIGVWLASN